MSIPTSMNLSVLRWSVVGILAIVAFVHIGILCNGDSQSTTIKEAGTEPIDAIRDEPTKFLKGNVPQNAIRSVVQGQQQPHPHLIYECPVGSASYENTEKNQDETASLKYNYGEEIKLYQTKDREILNNVTDFAEHFRAMKIDNYHRNYRHEKDMLSDWKRFAFQNVTNDDTIYESATGIGLNVLITAEVLEEELGITDVTFYGNDFVPESVEVLNNLFNKNSNVLPSSMNVGSVCTSDSRNLSHVPSNSFDYVYSGYITPLQDPLEYGTDDWSTRLFDETCLGSENNDHLNLLAQQRQEEWFRQWLSEMIRIAKPGAPIMVEEVAEPYCEMSHDWGGVSSSSFWYTLDGIDYDEPIHMERQKRTRHEDHTFGRYNVLMKKKKTNAQSNALRRKN